MKFHSHREDTGDKTNYKSVLLAEKTHLSVKNLTLVLALYLMIEMKKTNRQLTKV